MRQSESKVALVTGANRGIGYAIAVSLAKRGITPALAVRHPHTAAAVATHLRDLGYECPILRCDISDESSIQGAVGELVALKGRVDIVINNAATIEPIGLIGDVPPERWLQAIAVNLSGPYLLIRSVLPTLLAQGGGAIVNISSGAAMRPLVGWSAYCSSKAALAMLGRSVSAEYGKQGIHVYSLQPGAVDTDMQGRIRESGVNEVSRIPKSALLRAEVPAAVVAWLADTRPEDLIGQELSVNDPMLLARTST